MAAFYLCVLLIAFCIFVYSTPGGIVLTVILYMLVCFANVVFQQVDVCSAANNSTLHTC